jgi:hypothetical protein
MNSLCVAFACYISHCDHFVHAQLLVPKKSHKMWLDNNVFSVNNCRILHSVW